MRSSVHEEANLLSFSGLNDIVFVVNRFPEVENIIGNFIST